jgi:hypothetical protein
MLDEAGTPFLNGEPETARMMLRDLVGSTVGFEQLARLTGNPAKSLHRMLSLNGNPSMDNRGPGVASLSNSTCSAIDLLLQRSRTRRRPVAGSGPGQEDA